MNPSIELFDQRGLALKKEVTEGAALVPAPATDAFQLINGKSSIEADAIDRAIDRPYQNSGRTKYTNFRGVIEGSIELVPPAIPGTQSAAVGLGLQIAGMAEVKVPPAAGPVVKGTVTYNPISRLIPTATGYFYHAGTLLQAKGMRANISGLSMEIGKYLMAQFRAQGSLVGNLGEAALPNDFDFSKFLDPTDASTETMELTIDDFAVNGLMLSLDFGNDLKTTQHTEARRSRIGKKASTFKSRFYRTALADFDPVAKWRAGSIIELVGTTIEPDNRFSRLTVMGQITKVDPVDIDGEYGWEISGKATAVAGNDEFLIAFGEG